MKKFGFEMRKLFPEVEEIEKLFVETLPALLLDLFDHKLLTLVCAESFKVKE